jgi:tetratricopeptide (TPR) repeat protein
MSSMTAWRVALALVGLLFASWPARASEQSRQLCERGYDAVYNLDYDRAAELFKQAMAADPADAAAYRGAAKNAWLRILFLRGTVTSDEYLGTMNSSDLKVAPPPAALAAEFKRNIDRAVELGEAAVARHDSASAHYDLGAALGYVASYTGTIDGKMFPAMRAARRAFSEHLRVLELDPKRHDAGLVVGTYRYVVSVLPAPLRWMAVLIGFHGGRDKAIQELQQAAAYRGDAQVDARFGLVLIYNREGRYNDALAVVRGLERSFPRNRLLWLEEGGTAIRAGRAAEALRAINEGLARLQQDTRPRMPGEAAQLYYKRGAAQLILGNRDAARADLSRALPDTSGPVWVRGRIHTELGKLADLAGDRTRARTEYGTAVKLGEQSNDSVGVDEAKRLLDQPYRQQVNKSTSRQIGKSSDPAPEPVKAPCP